MLTEPMLVGPPACIRDVAARHGIDVADLPIIESATVSRAQSQSWFRREGGGLGPAGEGWSFDEGQSAHGRIDGCGRCARYRQSDRTADEPLLRDGCAWSFGSLIITDSDGEHRADAAG